MYERERREQEMERERKYASRADPRDRGKNAMLDYGDDEVVGSRPGSVRKRRESDASMSSRRDNKVSFLLIYKYQSHVLTLRSQRSRRSKEPDPDAMAIDKEEVALQSGSEEGEIEEV
jgi:pre-mRNA-processing factor 40